MRTSRPYPIVVIVALALAGGLLAGCRAEEQGRPLIFHKGEYIGKKDSELDKKQLSELNDRVLLQSDASTGLAPAERPPAAAPVVVPSAPIAPADKALTERLQKQTGN